MTLTEFAKEMGLKKNPLNLTDEQIKSISAKIHKDHIADMDAWGGLFQKDEIKYDEYKLRMETCLKRCFADLNQKLGEDVCGNR